MSAKIDRFFDTITSLKGAAILSPAILLIGTAIAIGQNAQSPAPAPAETPATAAAAAPASSQSEPAGAAPASTAAKGGAFTAAQRDELTTIVKEILLANPEILLEAQNVLEARMDKIQSERMAVAVKENAGELFRPSASPVVGNAKGDVPVIEFFDYNCGYCKKAFSEVASFLDKDKKARFILKEFPILSKGSEEASKVALAAKLQGKYWEFHRAMLEAQGQANEADRPADRREARARHAQAEEGHGFARDQEGDRGYARARHQDGHPGHAALHRRRPHHPGAPPRTCSRC